MTLEERLLGAEEAQAWSQFLRTSQRLEHQLDRALRSGHGVSHTQYEILVNLADPGTEHGNLCMTDLADRLATAKSAITYQVNQLVDRGLVERVKAAADQRNVIVRLTPEGLALLEEVAPAHLDRVRRWFIDQMAPGQLTELRDALERTCGEIRAVKATGRAGR